MQAIANGRSAQPSWADRLGIWTSTACVVHCVLTPVLLSSSVVLAHLLPSDEKVHRTLALALAGIGSIAVVRGLRRHHRRRVAVLMAVGLALISLAALMGDDLPAHWMEIAITMAGSGAMIAAHRLNHTFCEQCRCTEESC